MRLVALILLILWTINLYSQTGDYYHIKRKKISLIPIDTTELFIYETDNAKLYFSQNDIWEFLNKKTQTDKIIFQHLIDTLQSNDTYIEVKADSIYDKVYTRDFGSFGIQKGVFPSGKDKRDYLTESFRFISADLMLQGRVLLYSKDKSNFESRFVICKRTKGLMGSKFLTFRFPDRTEFYRIIISFGE